MPHSLAEIVHRTPSRRLDLRGADTEGWLLFALAKLAHIRLRDAICWAKE